MICPNCHREVSDESHFCKYCGSTMTTESGPITPKRKKWVLWVIIGLLIAIVAAWFFPWLITRLRVAPSRDEDRSARTSTVQNRVIDLIDFLDPIINDIASGKTVDLSSVEIRVACNRFVSNNMMERTGQDSSKDREYPDLYAVYEGLFGILDTIFEEDPAYGQLYSRGYLESHSIPFSYHCDDPSALCSEYNSLKAEFEDYLESTN